MDVLKFKQIAGSMKNAFGVQNLLDINDISKGTSVIAQEFRPGRPEPTPIEVIMQQTIDMTQRTLDFHEGSPIELVVPNDLLALLQVDKPIRRIKLSNKIKTKMRQTLLNN